MTSGSELLALGDVRIRRVGFGTMGLTGPGVWGDPRDRAGAIAVLRRAAELVDLIDTADAYGPETSERLVADALHPYRDGLVVATKGGYCRDGPWSWRADGRPEHLRAACEASLRRLRLDRIDLYQLHTVDRRVPIEESVGALAELRDEGKIGHVGLSNVGVEALTRAQAVVPVLSVQNRYNLAQRGSEPVLRACEEQGIAYLAWFPLAKSALLKRRGELATIARRRAATPAQIALAWLLNRSPVLVPIPGTRSVRHLEENVAAGQLELTAEERETLEGYLPSTLTLRGLTRGAARRFVGRPLARRARRRESAP
ncbi:MAG TPA: aldo/keto reductase [Gaiellaceae bacterium]